MINTFNLLYYSNAFIANHGGKLHSEAFLREARKNEKVNSISIHPTPSLKTTGRTTNTNWLRNKLKSYSFFQVLFFYRRNYRSFKDIVPVIKASKIDCLHIRIDSNFLIIKKLRKFFPELIITTEVNASTFDENFNNIAFRDYFKNLERKCLQNSDANFFVSKYLLNSIIKAPLDSRDFVVHNGVDLELFKFNNEKTEREIVTFGYVGTIDYHKNLNILIDAFIQVSQKFPDKVHLLIVGDGPLLPELKKYVKENNLSELVTFTGWVKHEKILFYLNKMNIAIHHSANPYMSPLKIFEYMAVGLPVIGPDIPAVREIFEDRKDIILVRNAKEDLAAKMSFLIENMTVRNNIALNGSLKVRESYGWDSNADMIIKVMKNKIIENKELHTKNPKQGDY